MQHSQSRLVNALLHYDPTPDTPAKNSTVKKLEKEKNIGREEHQSYLNNKRSSSTSKIEFDTLNQEEQEFARKKLRNP